MKQTAISIYLNGSPIHSRVVEFLLERSSADENIVINFRGMLIKANKKITEFNCNNEEYLNGRFHVRSIFDYIAEKYGTNVYIKLYCSHSNYLLCKIHSYMKMGSYSYIEDGIGTYAALIDASIESDYFSWALGTDVSRETKKNIKGKIFEKIPNFIQNFSLICANKTWRFSRALSVNLFAVALRNKETHFLFYNSAYENIYLTISKFKNLKSVKVPIQIAHPTVIHKKSFLVLIPPRKLIGDEYFLEFSKELIDLHECNPEFNFDYKSHPADVLDEDYHLLIKYQVPIGNLIKINSNNETVIVAYELGYSGVVCYDSSATLYALAFLSLFEFECIDLCKKVTGREAYGVQLTTELAKILI